MNSLEVRAVTEANVLIEKVDTSVLTQIKSLEPQEVPMEWLKSSNDLLYSGAFSRCQGVCYLSCDFRIGALAHMFPFQNPLHLLTGEFADEKKREDPKKIFRNLRETMVIHAYNVTNHQYSEKDIECALNKIGIEKIVHIPIKSKDPESERYFDIMQEVQKGLVYFFPIDFDYGLCLDVRKCFNTWRNRK
jgi:hypothetical protein